MSLFAKLRGEAAEVAATTLYFLVSFLIVGVIKMLFLAEFDVHVTRLATTLVAALVVGKVVVVLDKTRLGDRFRRHALWLDVFYKSFVYTSFCTIVLSSEKVIHEISDTPTLKAAFDAALQNAEIHRFAGTTFCLFLVFVGYSLMTALSEHFGKGLLLGFLFNAEVRRESRSSLNPTPK